MNKEREHRRVWTEQEDEILRTQVEQSKNINKPKWKEISEALNHKLQLEFKRNPKQCRQRWFNSLAPTCQQSKEWDIDDDVTLIQACKKYGHRWSRLAKQFHESINDNRLKNHFYSTVRKIVRVINTILKESKKQYQNNIKKGALTSYTEEQITVMKQILKLRTFEPKLLSKVFSLIDEKQQYRYQAKQSLEVEQLRSINNQILDYMEDYVTGKNQFTTFRILNMITKVMHVNRTIKTKYIREVKLSIQDQLEIQKEQENRKKRQKKINSIVKQELDNKIIPDRRTKIQIINKIGDENKKLKRLIRPIERRKVPKKGISNEQELKVQNEANDARFKNEKALEDFYIENENEQPFNKNQNLVIQKMRNVDDENEEYDQVFPVVNFNLSNEYDGNYLKNSILYNIGRDRIASPGLNFSSIFNFNQVSQNISPNGFGIGVNNGSFNYDQFDKKKNNLFEQEKSKSKSSFQDSQNSQANRNNIQNEMEDQKVKQNEKNANENPFASNFLNDIPLITSNNEKNMINQIQESKQILNPFLPHQKMSHSHSQGYFIFNPRQPEQEPQQQINQMFKSNPIIGSLNFVDANSQKENNQSKSQIQSVKGGLNNSRLFQCLLGSINYSSNNDKASEQSEKMKCSLFQLIPNFHPMHTSAFCPIFLDSKDNVLQQPKENRFLDVSKPFSAHNQIQKFNMEQSLPNGIQLYRSSDIIHSSNPCGASMNHSCSFGQGSQSNRSTRSKKKMIKFQ